MARTARLPISADRYAPCVRFLRVRGMDLSGAGLQMQVRLAPETPGAPLINLLGVSNDAQGLRVMAVTNEGGVPVSTLRIRIDETTLTDDLPFVGELGDVTSLAYDLQVSTDLKRVLAAGPFTVVPGVVGANEAPTNRQPGYGARSAAGDWTTATLTYVEETAEITIDGYEVAPLVAQAQAARDAALAAVAGLGLAVQLTQTNTSPAKLEATRTGGAIQPFVPNILLTALYDRGVGELQGVDLEIAGFNDGDPRAVLREDGSQIEADAWEAGDRLRLYFDGAMFRLVEPAPVFAGTSAFSEYQQIALSHARMGA